ncbi:hypothetical protein U27_01735 [Candidatus Vecturithrix granuli]|uniref:Uncharacterized protein n=1 Tax=Vecturithrix granuli TaxID=1499967 RepID=A0A0S6W5L7_VECG1|nr:hypothetical protein U27_01735 [Candidatus Vecturithrix granuli]
MDKNEIFPTGFTHELGVGTVQIQIVADSAPQAVKDSCRTRKVNAALFTCV